jgi:hypothetical protein
MNKFLVFAGVVATVAVIVAAIGDIAMTECKDAECKLGCKVVGKVTQGQCSADHFRHDSSFKATCANAPNALCVYAAIFHYNETTPADSCSDATARHVQNVQCDLCHEGHMKGEWQKISGCNASGTLTIQIGCDATCATCKHTYTNVKEKTCIPVKEMKIAVGYGAPTKCPQQILSTHYNTTEDCTGTSFNIKSFADSCYGHPGGSRMYHCN